MRWGIGVLVVAVAATGCASSRGGGERAADEMREGVRAASRRYWQDALFRFERAHELAPSDAKILNNLAVSMEALGRYEDALAEYKKALQIAPRDSTLKKNYARFAEFYSSYAKGVRPKGDSRETH